MDEFKKEVLVFLRERDKWSVGDRVTFTLVFLCALLLLFILYCIIAGLVTWIGLGWTATILFLIGSWARWVCRGRGNPEWDYRPEGDTPKKEDDRGYGNYWEW